MNHRSRSERMVEAAVDSFWVTEGHGPASEEWVLPSGRGQVVISLDGWTAQLIGPRTTSAKVAVAKATAGISLTGIGAYAIGGFDTTKFVDTSVDLTSLYPHWERNFVNAGADIQTGLHRLARELVCWEVGEDVVAVEAAIRGGQTATLAMERVAVDRRRFVSEFRSVVGTSPKQYERLTRFQNALNSLRSIDHASIAATAASVGYYDQAHLANETREFVGRSPSELQRLADDGRPNHIPVGGNGCRCGD